MFLERIKENLGENNPIFAEDIINLFPEYTRAYIFRLLKKAIESKKILKFSTGVYFVPRKTMLGLSTITADNVVERKYIKWNGNVYGVFSGLILSNMFSLSTLVPNVVEIVTNNETTRCRKIYLDGRLFILRKSRFQINNDNVNAYIILQLFSDLGANENINNFAKQRIIAYIQEKQISKEKLISLSMNFPARTIKNIMRSKILNEVA